MRYRRLISATKESVYTQYTFNFLYLVFFYVKLNSYCSFDKPKSLEKNLKNT